MTIAKSELKWAGASLAALAASLVAAPAMAAVAADDQPTETAQAPDRDDTIVVTGTRAGNRTALESTSPVVVIGAEDFRAQPAPQLQTILTVLVPSFNQQRNLLGDASAFVRPPTLRGLPGDQILVLINGKRMHRSALVQVAAGALNAGAHAPDLSQISSPAIGGVQILLDGAAAQYGSDAIAGVFNLQLRRDSDAYEVGARYGQSYRGDGEDLQLTAFVARPLGKDGGFINLTAEFIDQRIFDRSVPRPSIAPLAARGIITDFPTGNRLGGPENRAYRGVINTEVPLGDATVYAFAHYGWQRQGNDFNLRVPVTVTTEPIPGRPGTATIGRSVNPVFLNRVGFAPDGTPLWDLNGAQFNLNDDPRFPTFRNGFVPFFEATNEDLGIVGGVKGTEWGINYDFSLMYGTNQIRYFMSDTVNASLGPNTPTDFYMGKFLQKEFNFNADFSTEVEIGLAKPLSVAWGGEIRRESFEVGLGDKPSWEVGPFASQWLAQCVNASNAPVPCGSPGAGPPTPLFNANGTRRIVTALPGSNGFQGFGPASVVEGGRNNYSAYLDIEADITEDFHLGAAGRYDYFNDFGSTVNGKLAARWAITPEIAIRASTQTAFRAPTPGQQFTQNLTTGFPFGSTVPLGVATVRPDSPIGQFYLAQPLRPEKSFNISGGLVLTPGGGFSATLDFYQIKVRDRIGITGNINPAQDIQFLLNAGIPEAAELGAVRYFTNAFRTRTRGADLELRHRANTGAGQFNTTIRVNYNETEVTDRLVINGTLANGRQLVNFRPVDDVRKGNIERSIPRWTAVIEEAWRYDMFDFTGRVLIWDKFTTFFDPITAGLGPTPGSGITTLAQAQALYPNPWPKTFPAQARLDIEAGITFAQRHRFAVGVENLFNTFPREETRNRFPTTGGAANGSRYPDVAPIGQLGGFWYVRVNSKF